MKVSQVLATIALLTASCGVAQTRLTSGASRPRQFVSGLVWRSGHLRVYGGADLQESPDLDPRRPLTTLTPYYPKAAESGNSSLQTMIEAALDDSGNVVHVQATHKDTLPVIGIQATLDSLGVAAARQWKFEPWRSGFKPLQKRALIQFMFMRRKTLPEQEGSLFGRLLEIQTGQWFGSPNAGLGDPNDPPYALYAIHEDSFEYGDVAAGTYRLSVIGFGIKDSTGEFFPVRPNFRDTVVTILPGRSDTVYLAVRGWISPSKQRLHY